MSLVSREWFGLGTCAGVISPGAVFKIIRLNEFTQEEKETEGTAMGSVKLGSRPLPK